MTKTVPFMLLLVAIGFKCTASESTWPVEDACGIIAPLSAFNLEKGSLSVTMKNPGFVRVRVGIKNGPCLGTPLNWQYFNQGTHQFQFDNWWYKFLPASDYTAVSLGIAHEQDLIGDDDSADLYMLTVANGNQYGRAPDLIDVVKNTVLVDRHSAMDCHIKLSVDGKSCKTRLQQPVSKQFSLTIELEEPHRSQFTRDGFKTHIYMDGIRIYETWEGRLPMTVELDTTGYASGKSLLSVNLEGYFGTLAIENIIIEIPEAESAISGMED